MPQPPSILEILRGRASRTPDQTAYVWLNNGEREAGSLTYAELEARSSALAAGLRDRLRPGDRVLLQLPDGLSFLLSFFACLRARVVPVPLPLPRVGQSPATFQAAAADCQAAAVWGRNLPDSGLIHLRPEEVGGVQVDTPDPDLGDLAYLQSSGARGVRISHGNLVANLDMLREAWALTESEPLVSWLPLTHELGLVGKGLLAVYLGAPLVLMPATAFLARPLRWLQAISRYRAQLSGAPNFAYELCLRKTTPEQRAGLDLRGWRTAFYAAEASAPEAMQRFAEALAPQGFHRGALRSAYGVPEATLLVPEARIVSPDSAAPVVCGPGQEGEIWVSGPHVSQGYWNEPCATGRLDDTLCLRTGHLGTLREGRLVFSGRSLPTGDRWLSRPRWRRQAPAPSVALEGRWVLENAPQLTLGREGSFRGTVCLAHTIPQVLRVAKSASAEGPLWLVTRNGQSATGEPVDPTHTFFWGFGCTLMRDRPELDVRLVDLGAEADGWEGLLCELGQPRGESQVALRGSERFVARLERATPARRPAPVSAAGQYLVTGGTGALGCLTARFLLDEGAGEIVLAARERPQGECALWLEQNPRARWLPLDLSRPPAVRAACDQLPRLKGIVHAAGVRTDAPLQDQTWETFEQAMAARAEGAWSLHTATLQRDLDFFALFSSAAAWLGSRGQAGDSASHAFLGGLADLRGSLGLPALAIAWGPWEIGSPGRLVSLRGAQPIDPVGGLRRLRDLLGESGQWLVLNASWSDWPDSERLGAELLSESRRPSSRNSFQGPF